ncbi:MAG TPA: monofunctional biosynthetic peptidoglycan transglycosylase [Casimicrobiaceae bacterium]
MARTQHSSGGWISRALLLLVLAFVLLQLAFAAMIVWYRYQPPKQTAFMAERLAELRKHDPRAQLQYRWVSYARISPNLKRAIIASEDAKFVEHDGFDWDGIRLAREKNLAHGKVVAGGSTITQQLAKNLFLSPSRSYLRKGEEAIITVMLEAILDKRRILELYLNVIEWGSGIFGAEAAAHHYDGVAAAQLSAAQAARLAAMAPSPRRFERNPRSAYLTGRMATIMARMPAAAYP